MKQGTLIDATIIEAPRGREREDGSTTADPCASSTVKHGRIYHGYHAHIATDTNGVITDFIYDTASESEHTHFDRLAEKETQAVYADSGCRSQQRVEQSQNRGVFAGLCHRRVGAGKN
jgi:IS5 family transposase